MKKAILLFAAIALALTACGGNDDVADADLPVNDGVAPAIDATCLVDEPECDDTPGGEPQDLPAPGTDEDPLIALTPAEAADASGAVSITGFLVDVAGESRLCEVLAESFPPQCGGASVTLTSLDQIDPDSLKTEGDVTWTDSPVVVFGEMVDGTLVATPVE